MKLLPIPLSPLGAPPSLNMWNSELLWRYPSAPPSPLAELKTQMPAQLSTDPRLWNRDDVVVFLRWSEREFDLPKFELDQFQMNGKAICLLSKTDFGERCPGAGDLVHNVLHMLVRDAQMLSRHLPTSPLTPTSRYPLSPQSHPPTPNWSALPPPDSPFYAQHFQHFMAPNSVTLSPAPSNDSQAGSPPQEQVQTNFSQNGSNSSLTSNSTTSTNSDSDEDPQFSDVMKSGQSALAVNQNSINNKPNNQPTKHLPPPLILEPKILSAWTINDNPNGTLSPSTPSNDAQTIKREFFPNIPTPSTPSNFFQLKREFFPESPEPNTNGRLLWDFLQQLLNDPQQRYSTYIAWKCRDTGVFKIVDPAGLAKLWGIQKNHLSMNYDKMSRALRYYYRVNILRKVQGERHCYQFLRNPTELKSIKNISLLRQTMANQGVGARDSTQIQQSSQPQSSQLQYRGYVKQEQVLTGPPQSPSYNGSISHSSHYSSLTSIPVSSTSATNGTSPVPPAHPVNNRIPKSPVQSTSVKLESNELETDDKPTDLSTNSDRKFTDSNNCFPLIRNSNGLTTIQILRHDGMSTKDKNEEKLRSPSPQLQAALHIEKMDDMPTDLSKNEVTTYNNYR